MNYAKKCAAWIAGLALVSSVTSAIAAPSITNISPRGLQIGKTTTLVVTGTDLPADPQLIIGAPVVSQKVKPGGKPDRVELEITLDAAAAPDLYAVRIAGEGGISGPLAIGVDRLPQTKFTTSLTDLPLALHGVVGSAEVLKTKLTGKKGQRLVLDVEAQRLGSGLRPVLRLYDAKGTQIAWSPPRAIIGGDARIDTQLPADGEYAIELHDELFRQAGNGFFRLKAGDLAYADLAIPLGVSAGGKQTAAFASSSIATGGEIDASAITIAGETAARLPSVDNFTGAAPRVLVSDAAELIESFTATAEAPQELPAIPVAVSGVLLKPGEEDVYELKVAAGQKLRVEVSARQFGSPLDAVVAIRNSKGEQLASGDDRPGSSDPMIDYTVAAKTEQVRIAIKDLLGRGGNDFVYRIAIRDASLPDYSLTLTTDRINVPAGGTQVVPVQVTRMNYNGPIELSLAGSAENLSLQGNIIPARATIGLLTLSAKEVSPTAAVAQIIGQAVKAEPAVARRASFGEIPGSRYRPALKSNIGIAITRPSPISIAWLPGDDDRLFLGSKLPARVQFTRAEGTKGKIRLKLLTSQPTPKKTVKEGNQDKVVDDVERTLRLEGDATFGEDQKDVNVNILVPSDLATQPWDLVFVAELLSPDGKNVVTSLAAPVRSLTPIAPFTLALSGPAAAEGKAGTGETGKFSGKISRIGGYSDSLIITLDGLPKGYTAAQILVPADKDEFELPLRFGFGNKAGDLKNVKLVALSAPQSTKSVRSNPVDVAVSVVPGEKPELEQPKEVYEDDEKFVEMINEGGGLAIPDQRDKYSGVYALRVTPDQKYNANLKNLGVKIRENPGPGEFRYVRFAWKKAQGNSICIQLAHDGKFGPAAKDAKDSGRPGAKFRYHAGPGGECFGASLAVSDKIPARFEVVTRDLFLDFGEFTFTGLGFSPVDGQSALFDHIYLARTPDEFDLINAKAAAE